MGKRATMNAKTAQKGTPKREISPPDKKAALTSSREGTFVGREALQAWKEVREALSPREIPSCALGMDARKNHISIPPHNPDS